MENLSSETMRFLLSVTDIEKSALVLRNKVCFVAGSEFLHFKTQDACEKASAILKEWYKSKLNADEFADWQSDENMHLTAAEFKLLRRGHFRSKAYGI